MLVLNGGRFTSGLSRFYDQHPRFTEPTAKVYVKIAVAGFDVPLLAQVDTGAAYSTLETQVAEALGMLDLKEHPTRISTRLGAIGGQLVSLPITLIADVGESLDLEATFFISREWTGATFLGYTGLLDRLRIALDAPANAFHFGDGDLAG